MKHDDHDDHDENIYTLRKSDMDEQSNLVAQKILDSAFKTHRAFGPGLLESAYEHCMVHDLAKSHGFSVERQKVLPITFEGCTIEAGYRLDLVVDNRVVVEIKAVDKLLPIHEAQLMTYLRLSENRIGLLINFNEKLLKNGIRRMVV